MLLAANKNYRQEMIETCKRLNIKNFIEINFFDTKTPYEIVPESKYEIFLRTWYQSVTGKKLDLKNPKTFNEKIQWLKLYDHTELRTRLMDKYSVKEWVKNKIGAEYVIPLIAVYDDVEEIAFDKLPEPYVLKCTNSSGGRSIVIVKDKSKLNIEEAKFELNKMMKYNLAYQIPNFHYRDIPTMIIAEEYMEDASGELIDYKFFCFDGEPKYIQVDRDRFINHVRRLYDIDWQPQEFLSKYPLDPKILDRPEYLPEMIEIAKKLSEGFIHVRVDLYCVDGKVYFGEMTFNHGAGVETWYPDTADYDLGKLIRLPIEK